MNEQLTRKIAAQEFKKRQEVKIPDVLQDCLPYQLEFIKDPSRRKCICSTRRSAKSYCVGLCMVDKAINTPKAKLAYLTLTYNSAESIIWTKIIETICVKYNIKAHLNSKHEIEFENGSIIYLVGLDATPKQMGRLRGNAYELVIIDECQDFTQDLEKIVKDVLKMSLAQTRATLCMIGTPGNQMGEGETAHYWWKINRPNTEETEWKPFFFDWKKNTSVDPISGMRVCDAINEEIEDEKRRNPKVVETPSFKREVMGEWFIEDNVRVYKSTHSNYVDELPYNFLTGATYLLSMDLGYHDATAYVVSAYNKRYNDKLYILESDKFTELTITAAANKIKEYQNKYQFRSIYVDAANLQAVEEMRQIHNLPLQAAEKQGKEAHIALLNSDFITENIFILKKNNQLIAELNHLIWDVKALAKGKHKEDGSKENHLTDALLYAHHGSRHYWYKAKVAAIEPEEEWLQTIEKQFEKTNKKGRLIKKPFWEDEQ